MAIILGLDLGTSSLGWALIDSNKQQIIDTGVRIFPEGIVDKGKGEKEMSKNATRRVNRGARRQNFRRKVRKNYLLKLLRENNMAPHREDEMHIWFGMQPYQLRSEALDREISMEELGRVFYHMIQRRGFQSNSRKVILSEKSPIFTGAGNKKGIGQTQESIVDYRTLGEFLANTDPHEERLRNRYTTRKMYIDEYNLIVTSQKRFHPELTDELIHKLGGVENHSDKNGVLFHQRPLRSQKFLLGKCSLEKTKSKSPISSILFEKFRAWTYVNNITCNGEHLNYEDRKVIVENLLYTNEKPLFKRLRKLIGKETDIFKFNFKDDDKAAGCYTISHLSKFRFFGKHWFEISTEEQEKIWHIIYEFDSIDKLEDYAKDKWQLSEEAAAEVARLSLKDGYSSWSSKAINNIFPFVSGEECFTLDVATAMGGVKNVLGTEYHNLNELKLNSILDTVPDIVKSGETGGYLSKLRLYLTEEFGVTEKGLKKLYHHSMEVNEVPLVDKLPVGKEGDKQIINIKNPVVCTALFEVRKVINELIDKYGKPAEIKIEMARDLKASKQQRQNIEREQRANQNKNDAAVKWLKAEEVKVTYNNILKYKLLDECGGVCPFTGKMITKRQLFMTGEVQIEHIQPYSKTLNDSFTNKTLCYADVNREKGNRTPFEYFGNDTDKWQEVKQRVLAKFYDTKEHPKRYKKFLHFVKEKYDEDFVSRQLNDTRHISVAAKNYLSQIVPANKIITPNGAVTAKLRHFWGFNRLIGETSKKERDDHRHHAIDALVVAFTNQKYIQEMSRYHEQEMNLRSEEFPRPWEDVWMDAKRATKKILISHKKNKNIITRKTTSVVKNGKTYTNVGVAARGQLHKESVFGQYVRKDEKGIEVKQYHIRKNIEDFKDLKQLGKIVDRATFNLIDQKIKALGGYEGKAKSIPKEFFNPDESGNILYMPNKNGADIPVRKVRIKEEIGNAVKLKVANQFVNPRNNHHVMIYKTKDGLLKEEVVSFWTAVERKKTGESAFKLPNDGVEVVTTMQINDMFILGLQEDEIDWKDQEQLQQHLYKVQKIAGGSYFFEICFKYNLDSRPDKVAKTDYRYIKGFGDGKTGWYGIKPIAVEISISGMLGKRLSSQM
jgi:CRISPR-associated endonuclease Csn1